MCTQDEPTLSITIFQPINIFFELLAHARALRSCTTSTRDLQKNSKSNFDCLGQLAGYIPLLTFCEFLHLKMGCAFSGDNHRVPKVFRRKKVGIFFSAGKHLLTLQELLTIDRQIYGSTETLFISQ